MRQRYEVSQDGKWFASVHAATADEAIHIACNMTDGRDAQHCAASPTHLVHPTNVPAEVLITQPGP